MSTIEYLPPHSDEVTSSFPGGKVMMSFGEIVAERPDWEFTARLACLCVGKVLHPSATIFCTGLLVDNEIFIMPIQGLAEDAIYSLSVVFEIQDSKAAFSISKIIQRCGDLYVLKLEPTLLQAPKNLSIQPHGVFESSCKGGEFLFVHMGLDGVLKYSIGQPCDGDKWWTSFYRANPIVTGSLGGLFFNKSAHPFAVYISRSNGLDSASTDARVTLFNEVDFGITETGSFQVVDSDSHVLDSAIDTLVEDAIDFLHLGTASKVDDHNLYRIIDRDFLAGVEKSIGVDASNNEELVEIGIVESTSVSEISLFQPQWGNGLFVKKRGAPTYRNGTNCIYTDAVDGPGTISVNFTESVLASFSANITVTASVVTAGVGFNVTKSYSVGHTGTVTGRPGYTREIYIYPRYMVQAFDIWDDGWVYDSKEGSGVALKPFGLFYKIIDRKK